MTFIVGERVHIPSTTGAVWHCGTIIRIEEGISVTVAWDSHDRRAREMETRKNVPRQRVTLPWSHHLLHGNPPYAD